MPAINQPDHQVSRFIFNFCRDFQQSGIVPQRLSINKINAMLLKVGLTFCFVKLKSDNGIKNIPLLIKMQAPKGDNLKVCTRGR